MRWKSEVDEIIMKYNKEYAFLDSIISDFEKYIAFVATFLEKQRTQGRKIENVESHVTFFLVFFYHKS